MFFCSGMPILLGFAAAFFFVKYWCDKYLLLRYNSKPPALDEKIALKVSEILPLALYLHLGVSCFVYGVQDIFPSSVNLFIDSELEKEGVASINVRKNSRLDI